MNDIMTEHKKIAIYGARTHNLKNFDLTLNRNELIVFTGLSGSGKSSLAFDTIFAEGQRRYIETFSSYVRQFIGGLERPDVDKIDGLSPVIAIEQKTTGRSPRSTVGTITELNDFLRLLFARVADAYSLNTRELMVKYTDHQICEIILEKYQTKNVAILAPKIRARKGHYKELLEQIVRQGYSKARIDGKIINLTPGLKLDRYKTHDIEIVVDRFKKGSLEEGRLLSALQISMKLGGGTLMVVDMDNEDLAFFSRSLMCPTTGISYPEPEPNLFSFNSPYGACSKCNGLGEISAVDVQKIIPDRGKSIKGGALAPLGSFKNNWFFEKLNRVVSSLNHSLNTPLNDFLEHEINLILYGNEDMELSAKQPEERFEGLIPFILKYKDDGDPTMMQWIKQFMEKTTCPECGGFRLKQEALHYRIGTKNIGELGQMDLEDLASWVSNIDQYLSADKRLIAREIIKEIQARLSFILDVGLGYLNLSRPTRSLSGGEAQRIRLATQIGSELINVLYILDEPSIGLHQSDNQRLIQALLKLKDSGNTVLVVEHDRDMMESADCVVDIGPKAGVLGGSICYAGTYNGLLDSNTLTAEYLSGRKSIDYSPHRRSGNGQWLQLKNATGNTLKSVNLSIPLGTLTCITGVSGSGKSTLINQTLYPLLMRHIYGGSYFPLPFDRIEGLEHIDKVINIDQSPIGRTPRSNPVTYTKVFDEIRSLFASLPEAQIRGYKPGRFSFNVAGGKCETCNGGGLRLVEMNFLPDVYVTCEVCQGKRYNDETLQVKFKGKSISDVLNLPIEEAVSFFESVPKIQKILATLKSVGLGYLTLGQPSTTLSGGEAQRIKLAAELCKKATGKTIYLLDEPSTGLHFEDIKMLLDVLQRLVNEGNTVLVIEHNMDIIKCADYLVDMGPEGGKKGGKIIAKGSPEQLIEEFKDSSLTAKFLKEQIDLDKALKKNVLLQ
jgi:excinuclease ABC subunit A